MHRIMNITRLKHQTGLFHLCKVLVCVCFTFIVTSYPLHAQPLQLIIDYVDASKFPSIQISLHVVDETQRLTNLTAANFTVLENGVNQSPLFINCTEDSAPAPISFMLVMDKSRSMILKEDSSNQVDPDSTKFRAAKKVFSEFVLNLQSSDEAAYISFDASVDIESNWTNDKNILLDAIFHTSIGPGTAIFDALKQGLQLLSSRLNRKVIVLLTDGNDNSSITSMTDIIAEAKKNNIPIYCIGLGGDVNAPQLQTIALETGGEYFFAPTAKELADMYQKISSSIFKGICKLSYTTSNPCLDGTLRNLEITFNKDGRTASRNAGYFAPYIPDSLSITMGTIPPTSPDTDIILPVYFEGKIDSLDQISFLTTYTFDPAVLEFVGIIKTGTLSESASSQIRFGGNGEQITFEVNPFRILQTYPSGSKIILFYLKFHVKQINRQIETSIELINHLFKKKCSVISNGSGTTLTIMGCPAKLNVAVDSNFIAQAGSTFLLPVRLKSFVDTKQMMRYDFTFSFDAAILEYINVVTTGSITQNGMITASLINPDRLSVQSTDAFPKDTSGVLFFIQFKAKPLKVSLPVQFKILSGSIRQSCTPALSLNSSNFLLDGTCNRISSRRNGFSLRQNEPNPTNPNTAISFSVFGDEQVKLQVFNTSGKLITTLVNERLREGTYRVFYSTEEIPSGTYFYRLTEGAHSLTRKMIVLK